MLRVSTYALKYVHYLQYNIVHTGNENENVVNAWDTGIDIVAEEGCYMRDLEFDESGHIADIRVNRVEIKHIP